jgi:hypothetical protein
VVEVETAAAAGRPGVWGGRWWRRPDGALIVLRGVNGGIRGDVEEALGVYELSFGSAPPTDESVMLSVTAVRP